MAKMLRAIALARSSSGTLRRSATLTGPLERNRADLAGERAREEPLAGRREKAAAASGAPRAADEGADVEAAADRGQVVPAVAPGRLVGAGSGRRERPADEGARGSPPATVTSPNRKLALPGSTP